MQAAKLVITAASMSLATVLAQPANAAGPQNPQMHTHASIVLAAAVADQTKVNATKAALRDLWIGHVFWVRNVVVAGLAGDAAAQRTAEKQVVGNAQSIAGSIEPFYGKQLQAKDFAGEAQTWADMTQHMYVIADALAGAIAKQFPAKF